MALQPRPRIILPEDGHYVNSWRDGGQLLARVERRGLLLFKIDLVLEDLGFEVDAFESCIDV